MKTRVIARSGERTKKKWANERYLPANLKEFSNDVLDQRSIVAVQKFSNFALYPIDK